MYSKIMLGSGSFIVTEYIILSCIEILILLVMVRGKKNARKSLEISTTKVNADHAIMPLVTN